MESNIPQPVAPLTQEIQPAMPDAERREMLKRLAAATVTVPVATLLHDASRNALAAS